MSSSIEYFIISFPSTHHAIAGEKVAEMASKAKGLRLVPIPPDVSAGCGLALNVPSSELTDVLQAFRENNIGYQDIFEVLYADNRKTYQKKILN